MLLTVRESVPLPYRFLNSLEVLASPAMFVQCLENIIVLCMVSLEASTVEVNVRTAIDYNYFIIL